MELSLSELLGKSMSHLHDIQNNAYVNSSMGIIDPMSPPNSVYGGPNGYPDEPLDWPDILIIVVYFVVVLGVGIGVSIIDQITKRFCIDVHTIIILATYFSYKSNILILLRWIKPVTVSTFIILSTHL